MILANKKNTFVEISSSFLKILYSESTSKGPVIKKLIVEPISALSDQDISKSISDIIDRYKVPTTHIFAILSRQRAMIRYIKLPSTDSNEIEKMVSYEIAKQTPYSEEEIISDYSIISTDSNGYSEIMLVLSPKIEITRIKDILKPVSKQISGVRLNSEALAAWAGHLSKNEATSKIICLVDVDASSTEMAVVSNNRLIFSRSASIGAENIAEDTAEADLWNKRLIDEIKRTLSMYIKEQAEAAAEIDEFVVTGSVSTRDQLSIIIKEEMSKPTQVLNPLAILDISDGALTEEGVPDNTSISAISAASYLKDGINLLSDSDKLAHTKWKKIKYAVIYLSLGIFLLALCFGIFFTKLYQKVELLSKLESMLELIEDSALKTEGKLDKLNIIKSRLAEGTSSLDVIYNLYKLVPGEISLIDFNYDDTTRVVRFKGKAQKMSAVFKLVTILEGSDYFSNVQTRSVSEKRTREGASVDFLIKCNFIPRKDSSEVIK